MVISVDRENAVCIEPDHNENIPCYPTFRNSAASGGSVSFSE